MREQPHPEHPDTPMAYGQPSASQIVEMIDRLNLPDGLCIKSVRATDRDPDFSLITFVTIHFYYKWPRQPAYAQPVIKMNWMIEQRKWVVETSIQIGSGTHNLIINPYLAEVIRIGEHFRELLERIANRIANSTYKGE